MRQIQFIRRAAAAAVIVGAGVVAIAPHAEARDFFSSFFGGLMGAPQRAPSPPPFVNELFGGQQPEQSQPRIARGGGTAYCVRTCDGRYFPLSASGGQSRAESCNSLCPASETKVVYGSTIDNAATDSGKPYSDLPNAFKYRTELVAGCTCNGKDAGGLAKIDVEKDPTLRKGDIVASADGLVVATRGAEHRGAAVNFSPVSRSARAQFSKLPVVAAQ